MFDSIFCELEDEMLWNREKYCFAHSMGVEDKNGVMQQRYWFKNIRPKTMKKLIKSFTKLRDKCDKEGKYLPRETHDEIYDEVNNESLIAAITGNATPEDYKKSAQEWDDRVPVDKGDLDKISIER
jgi:hypothetical protein